MPRTNCISRGAVGFAMLLLAAAPAAAQQPDGLWTPLREFDGGPPLGARHYLFLDEQRSRLLLYSRAGIWTVPLDGSAPWEQLPAANHPPLPPGDAAFYVAEQVVFDAATNRLVSGYGPEDLINQNLVGATHALDLGTAVRAWTRLCDGGPLNAGAMVLDSPGRRLAAFGGRYDGHEFNTTGTFRLDDVPAWQGYVSATPPVPRYGHAASFDPVLRRMWVLPGGTFWPGASDPPGMMPYLDLRGAPQWGFAAVLGEGPSVSPETPVVYDAADAMFLVVGSSVMTLRPAADGASVTWGSLRTLRRGPGFPRAAVFDESNHRVLAYDGRMWALDLDFPPGPGSHGPTAPADPAAEPAAEPPVERGGGGASAESPPAVQGLVSSGGRVAVRLSLPDATPARIDVLDISGRLVATREVVGPSAGTRRLELMNGARLRPGVYLLRVSQNGRVATARAVVLD